MARIKGSIKTGGRKKGTPNKSTQLKKIAEAEALKIVIKKYLGEIEALVEAKLALAKGFYFKTKKGHIYKVEPNNSALEDIFNRLFGKAEEKVDITSKGEKITGFNYIPPK